MVRKLAGLGVLLSSWSLMAGVALASPVDPGVRIGEWVYRNVTALFAPLLAVMAIYFLAKRQMTQFISFAIFAVVAALFIYGGEAFTDAAVDLAKWIIGQ